MEEILPENVPMVGIALFTKTIMKSVSDAPAVASESWSHPFVNTVTVINARLSVAANYIPDLVFWLINMLVSLDF